MEDLPIAVGPMPGEELPKEQQEPVALVPKPPTSPHPQSPAPRKHPAVAGPAAAGLVPGGSDKSDGAKNEDGGAFKSEGAKSDDGGAAKSAGAADVSESPPLLPQGDRDVGSSLEDVPLLFEAGAQVLEESPLFVGEELQESPRFVGEELQEPAIDDLKNRALDRMLAGIDSGALERAFEDALRPLDGPCCKHEEEVAELKKQLEQMRAENESLRLENKQLKEGSRGVGADSRSPVAAGSAINAIRAAQGGGEAVHAT
mmetsp:Transcript_16922/g.44485  ORF Transcript_16922/g.44485 Transcript_16922/m.44485 type:complete len:258 (+) Transcript_16922:54-827(+)